MEQYILALDQGTTSCRAILFDKNGIPVSTAQKEFRQIFPKPGWVEHDPEEIWECQLEVAKLALKKSEAEPEDVKAIGITNQRETTVVWDKNTDRPVSNAIVWQCRRTADRIKELKEDLEGHPGFGEYVHKTTGLIPDAYFSASKIEWILENTEGTRKKADQGDLLFGTIDSWLIWKLTGGKVHATDRTNASRTMLYNIAKDCWDEGLLECFSVPESMLPEVKPSGSFYGLTEKSLFGTEIPICAAVGDQQSALFGQLCFEPGEAKNTYGTGCFLLFNTGNEMVLSESGMLTTIAAGLEGEKVSYALEGSAFAAGAAVQWLKEGMHLFEDARESETMAFSVADTGGVYVVPAFSGLGAPYWDPYARGTITGLTRGSTREHVVRATLEAIAYQTKDILEAMLSATQSKLSRLLVDGGMTKNKFLMQFQADISGIPVIRPGNAETTAFGAACLAGLQCGFWKNKDELKALQNDIIRYEPEMAEDTKIKLYRDWHRAVERAKGWAE